MVALQSREQTEDVSAPDRRRARGQPPPDRHGEDAFIGLMVESHFKAGRQDLVPGKPLVYGKSIPRLHGWEERTVLKTLAERARKAPLVKAENPSQRDRPRFSRAKEEAIRRGSIKRWSVPVFGGPPRSSSVQDVAVRGLPFTGDEAQFVQWGSFQTTATTIIRR